MKEQWGLFVTASGKRPSVVDLGCGECKFARLFLGEMNTPRIGIDVNRERLRSAFNKKRLNGLLVMPMYDFLKRCKDDSWDVILFLDSLEHVTKEEGLLLLEEAHRVARVGIIIFIPEGEVIRDKGLEPDHHKAIWVSDDFDKKGFNVAIFEDYHKKVGGKNAIVATKIFTENKKD